MTSKPTWSVLSLRSRTLWFVNVLQPENVLCKMIIDTMPARAVFTGSAEKKRWTTMPFRHTARVNQLNLRIQTKVYAFPTTWRAWRRTGAKTNPRWVAVTPTQCSHPRDDTDTRLDAMDNLTPTADRINKRCLSAMYDVDIAQLKTESIVLSAIHFFFGGGGEILSGCKLT